MLSHDQEEGEEIILKKSKNVDAYLLMITKFIRMFSYGALGYALFLGLEDDGLSVREISLLCGLTLIGDFLITFPLTTRADRWGRRQVLIISSILKFAAGLVFATSKSFVFLVFAGTLGVITPTGGEIGPFTAIEQSSMTELLPKANSVTVSKLYAYYNLIGYIGQAFGMGCAGLMVKFLNKYYHLTTDSPDKDKAKSFQDIFYLYAFLGLLLTMLYYFLSESIESPQFRRQKQLDSSRTEEVLLEEEEEEIVLIPNETTRCCGSFISKSVQFSGLKDYKSFVMVMQLSALFMLDSFGGGFVMQSVIVEWFDKKENMEPDSLGYLMMGANILSGFSALIVPSIVSRIGPVKTMVYTHIPSNILLLFIPLFSSNKYVAVTLLLIRFSLSQMDVPARQAFVTLAVSSDRRSAAGGITNLTRSLALALAPFFLGPMLDQGVESFWYDMPFYVAGVLKTVYDLSLFFLFGRQQNISL